MIKKKLKNKIIITFSILVIVSLLVFLIVSYIDWCLLTGFVIGTIISILSFLLNELFVSQLLSKRRSFKIGFLLGIFKSIIWLLMLGGTFIGILFANNLLKNSWITGTFNIFTYIYGCLTIPIAIIIYNFVDLLVNKKIKRK